MIFFVLSGYFVGGATLRAALSGRFSWAKYLLRRATRLWIVLLPALVICGAIDWIGTSLFRNPQNIYAGPAASELSAGVASHLTWQCFLGNAAFLQGFAVDTFGSNVSLWSISYEFWFYIFLPLLLTVFVLRTKPTGRIGAFVLLTALAVACGPKICAYFFIWLMGAGVEFIPSLVSGALRRVALVVGGGLVLFTMYFELKKPIDRFTADLILGLVFSLFLWLLLHLKNGSVSRPYQVAARGLSQMSYTLYAVHMPLLVACCALCMPIWRPWNLSLNSARILFLVYGIVFACSWMFYWCFERNTDWMRRKVSTFSKRLLQIKGPAESMRVERSSRTTDLTPGLGADALPIRFNDHRLEVANAAEADRNP